MRTVPDIAADFVAQHEACSLTAYPDPASGGEPYTIGYGHTDSITATSTCTQQQARSWLIWDMAVAQQKLYGVLKSDVIDSLSEHQWSALLSFAFNVGAKAEWTIWKRVNAKQFDQVPGEMIKFVNAGNTRVQGLVNRRADEIKLWSTQEPDAVVATPPSSETRLPGATPPTSSDPVPMAKSSTLITGALGVAATVPVAAQQVTAAVAPYAEHSEWVGKIIAILATIAAASAVVVLVLNWLRKREARL